MSIDKTLAAKSRLARARNVLKREERIKELTRQGKFDPETSSPFGLQKTRINKIKKRAKKKKKKDE